MVEIMMPEQVDTELDSVFRVSAKLKTLDEKFKTEATETKADDRLSGSYKREKVERSRLAHRTAVDELINEFQAISSHKEAELASRLNPSPAKNSQPPLELVRDSDRILWKQNEQIRSSMAELVRLEQLKMHREDINRLGAVELVNEYTQAVENEDSAFCDAVEQFGLKRLKSLVASAGDKEAPESILGLNRLIEQRREEALTPEQKKAKADIEKLRAISGKFHSMAQLTKTYTLRRN